MIPLYKSELYYITSTSDKSYSMKLIFIFHCFLFLFLYSFLRLAIMDPGHLDQEYVFL